MTAAIAHAAHAALITLGWRERVALPCLGIKDIRVKIDTGAKTSSLHATHIEPFEKNGETWLRFNTQLKRHNKSKNNKARHIPCEALLIDNREVTSSSGQTQQRPVILAQISIGSLHFPIQLTLADRSNMRFSMLLGRRAMRGKFLIDPARSFTLNTEVKTT